MFRYRPILLSLAFRRYFIRSTSTIMTEAQVEVQVENETRSKCAFRCATFNMLAPCYKNIGLVDLSCLVLQLYILYRICICNLTLIGFVEAVES